MTLENIILYPRSYNKRGDESLHSVQGVTAEGEEVNVKLRIPANAKIIGAKPSIAEFARDDYGAKNVCLATPENGPENPGGMLLFTGCEPDGSNRKGITSYIARWAHRLVADKDSPSPIQGLGRVDVSKMTSKNRGLATDIRALREAKPQGWEERVAILETQLNNTVEFQYQLRMYRTAETRSFSLADREQWESHFSQLIDTQNVRGARIGAFVRIRQEGGKYLPEVASEMLPLFMTKTQRYQTGAEVLQWLHRQNPELPGLGEDAQIVIVPIECHTAGTVFRKHYGAPERYSRLLQQYYPGGRAELCHLIASRSMHEGEPMLLRAHPLTPPLAIPSKLAEDGTLSALMVGEEVPVIPQRDTPIEVGLNGFAPLLFPGWFNPVCIVLDEGDIHLLPDLTNDQPDPVLNEDADEPGEPDEMIIIDDIFEVGSELPQKDQIGSDVFDIASEQRSSNDILEPEPIYEPEPEEMHEVEPELNDRADFEPLQDAHENLSSDTAKDGGAPSTDSADPIPQETYSDPVQPMDSFNDPGEDAQKESGVEPAFSGEPFLGVEPFMDVDDEIGSDGNSLEEQVLTSVIEDVFPAISSQPEPEPEPEPELPATEPEAPLTSKEVFKNQKTVTDKPKPKGLAGFMARKGLLK